MLSINNFLQGIYNFVKSISKKAYRTCAIIASGVGVIAVISMASRDFDGSGKNNVTAASGQTTISSDKNDENEDASNVFEQIEMENLADISTDVASLKSAGKVYVSFALRQSETDISETEKEESLAEEMPLESANVEETLHVNIVSVPKQEAGTVYADENGNTLVVNNIGLTITEGDYEALKRIVEAEAGNQDEVGRMLVANVIVNRVKDSRFPNTIQAVIFKNSGSVYQFEPIQNGYYYSVTASQSTTECVNRVLQGEDYSQGALYFTRQTSQYSWFNTSLTFLFIHGAHYFYR